MRRMIGWLDTHFLGQPTLAEMAALAGLSESQFHREFVRWTGVTPKDFVQCLTMNHARSCLVAGAPVLDAAIDAGLSGPGRLHDLCVSLTAATPGEIKSGGAGIDILWGMAETPFGCCRLGETERGVCHLSFVSENEVGDHPAANPIASDWPGARLIRDDAHIGKLAERIFLPRASGGPVRAWVRGSAFQIRVWRALLEIPAGSLTTYGRIATAMGMPQAARAVGAAVGSNDLAFLIPCHRVIRGTGAICGYRWGVGRKRALIAWEGARCHRWTDRPPNSAE